MAKKARSRRKWVFLLIVLLLAIYLYYRFGPGPPEEHADIESHFKYGSIGSDNSQRGLPYWIWRVLPNMFPEYLPDRSQAGYASFGLVVEPRQDRPIGFSRRRTMGIDIVGLNCAICHTSTLRESPESKPQIISGMPANTFDLQAFSRFLFACAMDGRFTADNVIAAIEEETRLGFIERILYRFVVYRFREAALLQRRQLAYFDDVPDFGPGRVDTFGPYKVLFFDLPIGQAPGTADFPSLWNQKPKAGMDLHWDGNNDRVEERNISASIGAGVTPQTLDRPRLKRVEDWIWELPSPRYPEDRINQAVAAKGRPIYEKNCGSCHSFGGTRVGKVVDIADIQTDPNRLTSFTPELARRMNTLGTGYPWKFTRFKKTNGYSSPPLDGVWLRAPYLHNGSVPTLADLLEKPAERPKKFYRGNDVYDWARVGFVSDRPGEASRKFFEFDTGLRGNGNGGHLYGTDLASQEKQALLEYLKTL